MLTSLSSLELALVVVAILFGATGLGIWIGRVLSRRKSGLKEPLGIMQGALVGFVALLLAFGLTMAVGRYRRGATQSCWKRTRSAPPTCAPRRSPNRCAPSRSSC